MQEDLSGAHSVSTSSTPDSSIRLEESDATQLWASVLENLRETIDPQIHSAWIKPLRLSQVSAKNGSQVTATIEARNKFSRDHVEHHYSPRILKAFHQVFEGKTVEIAFKVASSDSQGADTEIKAGNNGENALRKRPPLRRTALKGPGSEQQHKLTNLNCSYNFSNFVVGDCNQFSHAVSLRVSEALGSTYNPLFIYGGVGLGKTHLANAIGNASYRRGKKVLLVSSETFVSELINSLRTSQMSQFKEKFRSLDLLIIDDIQFIIGKERTQEEFFHTFNELYQRNKQIVMTSDKLPQELVGIEERLRTRFASGLSADLQAPDYETRVAIISKKSEVGGFHLPDNVAQFLAERIDTNVRELEGALNRLQALSLHQRRPVDLSLAEEVMASVLPENLKEVNTEDIQKVVAKHFNVGLSDILGKRRTQNIAFARQVAMYLCRKLVGSSYPEIGALFGGRDHSTVIHANRVITEKIELDSKLADDISHLEKRLKSGC